MNWNTRGESGHLVQLIFTFFWTDEFEMVAMGMGEFQNPTEDFP